MGIQYDGKETKAITDAWRAFEYRIEQDATSARMINEAVGIARKQATNILEARLWVMKWFERGYRGGTPLSSFHGMPGSHVLAAIVGAKYRAYERVGSEIRDRDRDRNLKLVDQIIAAVDADKIARDREIAKIMDS